MPNKGYYYLAWKLPRCSMGEGRVNLESQSSVFNVILREEDNLQSLIQIASAVAIEIQIHATHRGTGNYRGTST